MKIFSLLFVFQSKFQLPLFFKIFSLLFLIHFFTHCLLVTIFSPFFITLPILLSRFVFRQPFLFFFSGKTFKDQSSSASYFSIFFLFQILFKVLFRSFNSFHFLRPFSFNISFHLLHFQRHSYFIILYFSLLFY